MECNVERVSELDLLHNSGTTADVTDFTSSHDSNGEMEECHINTLPIEILSHIFELVYEQGGDRTYRYLYNISQVCTKWNQIISTTREWKSWMQLRCVGERHYGAHDFSAEEAINILKTGAKSPSLYFDSCSVEEISAVVKACIETKGNIDDLHIHDSTVLASTIKDVTSNFRHIDHIVFRRTRIVKGTLASAFESEEKSGCERLPLLSELELSRCSEDSEYLFGILPTNLIALDLSFTIDIVHLVILAKRLPSLCYLYLAHCDVTDRDMEEFLTKCKSIENMSIQHTSEPLQGTNWLEIFTDHRKLSYLRLGICVMPNIARLRSELPAMRIVTTSTAISIKKP